MGWKLKENAGHLKLCRGGERLCVHAKPLQSCPTLCNPMDCSPPGSSVPGIFQARILEWIAISSSRDLSDPGIEPVSLTTSHALEGGFFTTVLSGKPQ